MIETGLQFWGGGLYLLNKIFFSRMERSIPAKKRHWQIRSWIVYLIGLPAWVIIFFREHNWMAASVEAGGAMSMILGLLVSIRGKSNVPKWLDSTAFISAIAGVIYSLYDFGGITTLNQIFELGVVIGFLWGTYLLAKQIPVGYLFFALMNLANAGLMYLQNYQWLALQQIVSLLFVIDAYLMQKKKTLGSI